MVVVQSLFGVCPPNREAAEGAAETGRHGLGADGGKAHGFGARLRRIRLEERYGLNAVLAAVLQRLEQRAAVLRGQQDQAAVGR